MLKIADRLNLLEESQTLAMTRKSREMQAKGIDVINLSIGEPDFDTPDFIKAAAKKAIDDNYSHYPPVPGFMELRQAISNKFKRDNNLDYRPEQIVVSTGAKQALMNVVLSIVNKGDEVILPAPYWVSYIEMVKFAEGKPIILKTDISHDFKINPQQLKAALNEKTKLFIFSSPCNPSGSVYTKSELSALADIFATYPDVVIVSDEIYEHINYSGEQISIGSLANMKNPVVTVNGVSKAFAMTGWRIGYIGAPQAIADACIKIQGQFTSGANDIAQIAAMTAVNANPSVTVEMKNTFLKRRDFVLGLINKIPGLKSNVPPGAFYVFPDVSSYFGKSTSDKKINNADDLTMYLLENAHVATVNGDAFGNPDCIRLSYATSTEKLETAIGRIAKSLANLH